MVLLCLNCASADCTCGRLAWLVDFVNHAESAAEAAGDASAELEALFVLKPREE
jgi:hypothetical protein